MRKVLVLAMGVIVAMFIAFLCMDAYGQTWFTANQVTVAWNPVAKIETTDTIKYQVYLRQGTSGDGTAYGSETTSTQMLITLSQEGRWFVGVKTLRYVQGEAVPIPSETTSWSNEAEDTSNAPFGVVYLVAPSSVGGLRVVQ